MKSKWNPFVIWVKSVWNLNDFQMNFKWISFQFKFELNPFEIETKSNWNLFEIELKSKEYSLEYKWPSLSFHMDFHWIELRFLLSFNTDLTRMPFRLSVPPRLIRFMVPRDCVPASVRFQTNYIVSCSSFPLPFILHLMWFPAGRWFHFVFIASLFDEDCSWNQFEL